MGSGGRGRGGALHDGAQTTPTHTVRTCVRLSLRTCIYANGPYDDLQLSMQRVPTMRCYISNVCVLYTPFYAMCSYYIYMHCTPCIYCLYASLPYSCHCSISIESRIIALMLGRARASLYTALSLFYYLQSYVQRIPVTSCFIYTVYLL